MTKDKSAHPTAFPVLRCWDGAAVLAWLDRAFGFGKRVAYEGKDGSIVGPVVSGGPHAWRMAPSRATTEP